MHDRVVRVSAAAWVALTLVSVGLPARSARACSSFEPGVRDRTVWPSADKPLPTNGHLLVIYGASFQEQIADLGDDLAILDDSGLPVPLTRTRMGANILVAPTTALLPAQTYRLVDRRRLPCTIAGKDCAPRNAPVEFATFTTAAGPDTQAPSEGGLVSATPGERWSCDNGACCGTYESVPIELTWIASTDDVAGSDVRYNVYRQERETLVPVARFQPREFTFTGWQTCSGTWGGSSQVTPGAYLVRAVDYAGNEDPNAVTRSVSDQCENFLGCAVASEAPRSSVLVGPIAAALAFAFAILKGRRRSS